MSIYKALLEVQKEIKPVKKTSDNPFFKSKYADLEAVVEAVMPILSKHGIVAVQTTDYAGGTVGSAPVLITKLVHVESGDNVVSTIPIITKDSSDPQKVIAGLTYMRRASLTTICGLATQDDDGNAASDSTEKKESRYKMPEAKVQVKVAEKVEQNLPVKYAAKPNKSITPISVVFNTKNNEYKVHCADGDYYTEKEVVAKLLKQNIGAKTDIAYTVDENMKNVVLDVCLF